MGAEDDDFDDQDGQLLFDVYFYFLKGVKEGVVDKTLTEQAAAQFFNCSTETGCNEHYVCSRIRELEVHYHKCKEFRCPICSPVRWLILSVRLERLAEGGRLLNDTLVAVSAKD
jgi:hypothetical protein